MADPHGRLESPAARFEVERAMCLRGQTGQDLGTCLREAAAASAQARRDGLYEGLTQAQLDAKRFLRCDRLPDDDRLYCVARMQGYGTVSGSVEGGGIYRELVTLEYEDTDWCTQRMDSLRDCGEILIAPAQ
jgi:hypothetical protein